MEKDQGVAANNSVNGAKPATLATPGGSVSQPRLVKYYIDAGYSIAAKSALLQVVQQLTNIFTY